MIRRFISKARRKNGSRYKNFVLGSGPDTNSLHPLFGGNAFKYKGKDKRKVPRTSPFAPPLTKSLLKKGDLWGRYGGLFFLIIPVYKGISDDLGVEQ